ncbi:unnamed protein product [Timema podura]|uniref:Uncharacterized protein n=1 Tax=Timema podura TaxID=61482 RepID=A0ABN7PBS0_TIMPD|nr:unnamed protein product [Timema podura]
MEGDASKDNMVVARPYLQPGRRDIINACYLYEIPEIATFATKSLPLGDCRLIRPPVYKTRLCVLTPLSRRLCGGDNYAIAPVRMDMMAIDVSRELGVSEVTAGPGTLI